MTTSYKHFRAAPATQRRSYLLLLVQMCFALGLLWNVAAGIAWLPRNQCGNASTFITHYRDAMAFRRLPQFQERIP